MKNEKYHLYTKQYLEKLKDRCKEMDLMDFLVDHYKISFTDAVEALSEYLDMHPEYIKRTKD